MTEIINFIITNYTWILVIVILIFLAIIGSYAEKTNFGSGKKNLKEEKKDIIQNIDLSNKRMEDYFPNQSAKNVNNEKINQANVSVNDVDNNLKVESNQVNKALDNSNEDNNNESFARKNLMMSLEDKLSSLDNQINLALPKKDIINDSMLDEIEDLSFEEKKDLNQENIDSFSLDDLELPKIKPFKTDDEDVWKI